MLQSDQNTVTPPCTVTLSSSKYHTWKFNTENLYLQDYVCCCHVKRNEINNTFVWDMRQNSLLKVYIEDGSIMAIRKRRYRYTRSYSITNYWPCYRSEGKLPPPNCGEPSSSQTNPCGLWWIRCHYDRFLSSQYIYINPPYSFLLSPSLKIEKYIRTELLRRDIPF